MGIPYNLIMGDNPLTGDDQSFGSIGKLQVCHGNTFEAGIAIDIGFMNMNKRNIRD